MASGGKARLLAAAQTAKGVTQTALYRLLATAISIDTTTETVESPDLSGNPVSSGGFVSGININGATPIVMTRDSLELLLEGAGFAKTTGAGKNTYKHGATPKWYTVIKDITDDTYYETYTDCMISQITVNATKKAFHTIEITWEGLTATETNGTPTATVTELLDRKIKCLDLTTISLGGTDITAKVEDMKISINNNPDTDDRAINAQYRKDLVTQQATVEFSGTIGFSDTAIVAYKQQIRENTSVVLEINFDSKVKLTLPNAVLSTAEVKPGDKGRIKVPISGKGYYDVTSGTAVIVEVDTTAY